MDGKFQSNIAGVSPATRSPKPQQLKGRLIMMRTAIGMGALAITALLSACSAITSIISPTSTPAPAVMSTATSAPTSMSTASAVPTALDPCQLVTSQEASSLAGALFGAGLEGTTPGGGKTCTYGYQTLNVFNVVVGQAADVATAQADKAQFETDIQSKIQQFANVGFIITQLPNFADGASAGTGSVTIGGKLFSGGSFGFLKGTTFVGFSDINAGGAAPSAAAMQAEATTVLGRLP